MAKASVFLLSIVLMASLASLSHGLLINGLQIRTIEVRGVVRCTLTGNLNAPPVSAATVDFTCGGLSSNLGQALTDPAGLFAIVVNILDTVLFDPSTCIATVNLPVATCSVFPPDGVLSATVSLVNVIQTNLGNIANFTVGTFQSLWSSVFHYNKLSMHVRGLNCMHFLYMFYVNKFIKRANN